MKRTFSEVVRDVLRRMAERSGKPVGELRPWIDYDPIQLEATTHRIMEAQQCVA